MWGPPKVPTKSSPHLHSENWAHKSTSLFAKTKTCRDPDPQANFPYVCRSTLLWRTLPKKDEYPLMRSFSENERSGQGRVSKYGMERISRQPGDSIGAKEHLKVSKRHTPRCAYAPSTGTDVFFPPDRKGLLDFMLESAFAMLLHHAPTWPVDIPPEQLASGSRRVYLAEYPTRAARQWIPPSSPPEQPASESRRASR